MSKEKNVNKIYVVVSFDQGYYESDTDYTHLRAVSLDLDKLLDNAKKVSGTVLEIEETVFNQDICLTISSDSIDSVHGVKVLGQVWDLAKRREKEQKALTKAKP